MAALLALAASIGYLWLAAGYPRGSFAAPGAGYYPIAVGVFLVAVSAVLVYARFAGRSFSFPTPDAETPRAIGRVAVVCAALVGYVLLLPWAGYPLCAAAFVATLLWRLGGGAWWLAVLAGIAAAALTHYVFAVALGVALPRGVLFAPS